VTWTLIIADDEAPLRNLLRLLVARDGRFEVVAEAVDGEQALELVARHDPDLLLLDLGLPRLDGLQVLEQLGDPSRPRTVILTGFDDPHTHRQARDLGAADCLVKGRDFSALLDALEPRSEGPGRP
jgi:DNA-binding NarL/FixJ family response regulator